MTSFLGDIVAAHRRAAAEDTRDIDDLLVRALGEGPGRPFTDALCTDGLAVIAEVKRRSPSRGAIAPDLEPAEVASEYAEGGAACLSVLTDEEFFGGSAADFHAARRASGLPVLRKDFTVCDADLCDARLMGADAVLLIVAALSHDELASLHGLAGRLGLDALVEVHDEEELERAVDVGARLVGVNQRDLETFSVDPGLAARLAPRIPSGVVAVAESGIRGPDGARDVALAGYEAILVGETVVTAADRAGAVRELRGHAVGTRAAADAGHRGREPLGR